jgi:hypothetical protein
MFDQIQKLRNEAVNVEEEGDEEGQETLHPSSTFGRGGPNTDIAKDRSGLKLSTYDVWTKDRVRQLLPDKSQATTMEFIVGKPAPLSQKKQAPPPQIQSQGLKSSDSKKSLGNKKPSVDKNIPKGVPLVGIDLSGQARKSSQSKIPTKVEKVDSQTNSQKKPVILKQKDFGAYGAGIDDTEHLRELQENDKHCLQTQQPVVPQSSISRPMPFQNILSPVQSPTTDNSATLRVTAEFGSNGPQTQPQQNQNHYNTHYHHIEEGGVVRHSFKEEHKPPKAPQSKKVHLNKSPQQDDLDINDSPKRPLSEDNRVMTNQQHPDRGYYDIQIAKMQQKRDNQSSRSVLTTKSAAEQISEQKQRLLQIKM